MDIIKLNNFTAIQYSCRTNIYVVKWENLIKPKFWWNLRARKWKIQIL